MVLYEYRDSIHSSLEEAHLSVVRLLGDLHHIITDDALLFDVRLVVSELLINGCRHGNRMDWNKNVNVLVQVTDGFVEIVVQDEGTGIRYSLSDYDPSSLKTTGRGLRIVEKLSDSMSIDKNSIRVILRK